MVYKTPVWELPHGQGQGPRPGDHTLPPLKPPIKKAKKKKKKKKKDNLKIA